MMLSHNSVVSSNYCLVFHFCLLHCLANCLLALEASLAFAAASFFTATAPVSDFSAAFVAALAASALCAALVLLALAIK